MNYCLVRPFQRRKAKAMSLPESSQLELRNTTKIHFHTSFFYIRPVKLKKDITADGVLLEESDPKLRAYCYRRIRGLINLNEKLRVALTGSTSQVTLTQIIDSSGYGVVTTTAPKVGKFVQLTFHPHIEGKLQKVGIPLGNCLLGCVIKSPTRRTAT